MSIKPIVTNEMILSKVTTDATKEEALCIAKDLIENAFYRKALRRGCAGLAANQIGYDKSVLVIWYGGGFKPMINPIIKVMFGGPDTMREGCLSRPGRQARVTRSKKLRITFRDEFFNLYEDVKFTGLTARVIQHEVDHLNGKFIP